MRHNRPATESRFIQAATRILRDEGFAGWGINPIARTAGADKVLIYRYFGDLNGLLAAVVEQTPFWPDPDDLPQHSLRAFVEATLLHLRDHREAMVLLASPSPATIGTLIQDHFLKQRDRWVRFLHQHLQSVPDTHAHWFRLLPDNLWSCACLAGSDPYLPADFTQAWRSDSIRYADETLPTELL